MMKRHTRPIWRAGATLLLCGAATLPAMATDNVHFSGTLVASPCTLTMQETNFAEVDFGSLDGADFLPAGQTARRPLVFELTDCDSALSNGVTVTFAGIEVPGTSGILAVDSNSTAAGIGIGIETLAGTPVNINNADGTTFTLVTGDNTLSLNAWVQRISNQDLEPGTFLATATVTFEYL